MQKQIELNLLITVDVPETFTKDQVEKYLDMCKRHFFNSTKVAILNEYPETAKEVNRVTTKAGQSY